MEDVLTTGGAALAVALWLVMPVTLPGLASVLQSVRAFAPTQQAADPTPASASSSAPAAVGKPAEAAALATPTSAEREAAYAAKRVGVVSLEVSPIAQVFVNGAPAGTTPPLTQLKLPVGRQSIVLRSEGFDPYYITVDVRHDQPLELRHRFTR